MFNDRPFWVIRRNEKKQLKSGDIRVGDVVFLQVGNNVVQAFQWGFF